MAPRKPKAEVFTNHLLEQIKFVSHAQRSKGDDMSTHSMIRYGNIVAFDRTLAAGASIVEDDLDCCPQTDRLRLALEHCGAEYQIVQHADSLFVRSGEFQAYVPLCDPAKLTVAVPDPAIAPLGNALKAALAITGSLVKDSAPTLLQSCIQLNSGSCISTNGYVILQAWHGCDMPPGLLVPRSFADAVVKIRKNIVSFGFSKETLTIHYEDRSWLQTTLYQEKIPDMLSKLIESPRVFDFPVEFFNQVAEISRWSEDGRVYVDNEMISSHHPSKRQVGGSLEFAMPQLRQGVSYSIAALKLITKYAKTFDDSNRGMTMFYGDGLRGAIAHEPIAVEPAVPKCRRCGCEMKDGICQNYGCETPRDPNVCPFCAECPCICTADDIPF